MTDIQPKATSNQPTDPQLVHNLQALQRESSSHSEKLDRILEWIDKNRLHQSSSTTKSNTADEMSRLKTALERLTLAKSQSDHENQRLTELMKANALEYSSGRQVDGRELARLRDKLKDLEMSSQRHQEKCSNLEAALRTSQDCQLRLEQEIDQLKRIGHEAVSRKDQQHKDTEMKQACEMQEESTQNVKKIMNKVYKQILRQFQAGQAYPFEAIKENISQIIRVSSLGGTFECIYLMGWIFI